MADVRRVREWRPAPDGEDRVTVKELDDGSFVVEVVSDDGMSDAGQTISRAEARRFGRFMTKGR